MGSAGFLSYKKPGNPFCDLTPFDHVVKMGSNLLVMGRSQIVVDGSVEVLVAQLPKAFCDIVCPIKDDCGATLILVLALTLNLEGVCLFQHDTVICYALLI